MEVSWQLRHLIMSVYKLIVHYHRHHHRRSTDQSKNIMSESMEMSNFDVEAQQSLLAADHIDQTEISSTASARQTLLKIILVIRSTELFKLGANYAADITSSSTTSATTYAATNSSSPHPHDHIFLTQPPDSGIVAVLEISAESAQDILTDHSASVTENEQYYDFELQRVQREKIAEIVKKQDLHDLQSFGGVTGVAEALNTDLHVGISNFQENICHGKQTQLYLFIITLCHSFLGACNNYTIFLLFFAAILSLTFGIKEQGLNINGWIDGVVVVLTIVVLIIFETIQDFFLERKSQKKLENSWPLEGGKLKVLLVRGGQVREFFVSAIDLQVGDIVLLRKGDQVPADGVFVTGQALELEGITIKSTTIDENNPFLFYGSRVINGNARMIVTSTGMDTVWGERMRQTTGSRNKNCTFEARLHKLNTCIQRMGLFISILIITVLFLRYTAGKLDDENGYKPDNRGEPTRVKAIIDLIKGIITGSKGTARVLTTLLSVSLMGVMEGMPFVISIAIIIWNRKTLAHKASERDYLACVKMASVTTICTDKFGGLTELEKEIDKFFVGEEFVCESSVVASNVLEDLCDGIGTLFLIPPSGFESKVLPLISWAEAKLGMKEGSLREQCKVISFNGCNPYQERCGVLMEKTGNEGQKKYLQHYKGPPQDILSMCSEYYDIKGNIQAIDDPKKKKFVQVIQHMSTEAEVIGFACRCANECDVASLEDQNCSLTFLGMIGLKDTKLEDTKRAVSTLRDGGIRTILASGDDVAVLQTIGENCGLLVPDSDDLVLTAEEFGAWSDEEKMENLEKICIMGNCLPSDKILLIKCLKEKGKVVALLGQRTIDAPALRQADIGLTLGTWSSETARENCDISIWDGDLNFLIKVIENGRCFHENIRKFIQLELIITISSSLINFTSTLVLGDAPLTAIELFWLNLVVALVGGLALLTGSSTEKLMKMLPVKYSSAKLITNAMWRNIAIQASYQTTIFVTLQHKGHAILGELRVKSLIFNGFFLCQIFNKFIARMPEKKNFFRGLFQKNCWFLVALVILLMCQVVFAVADKLIGDNPGLNWKLWGICLFIGLICWLLDLAGKSMSNFIDFFLANQARL